MSVEPGEGAAAKSRYPIIHVLMAGVILTILLLWPLLIAGRPGYIADSASYYRGGKAAVAFVRTKIGPTPKVDQSTAPAANGSIAEPPPAVNAIRGIRSIAYSAMSFLLAAPSASMIGLVLLQAMAAAGMIVIFCRALGLGDKAYAIAPILLTAACVTSLPLFATLATPDMFAGLLILGVVTLFVLDRHLWPAERITLLLLTGLSVVTHASHLLLGFALLGFLLLVLMWSLLRGQAKHIRRSAAWAIAAILLGTIATLLSSLIGFKEVSVVPKRYPFALARSIEDGPARWYLEQHCSQKRYAVCELYPHGFPHGVGDFLWNSNGIEQRATPAQMDRIRSEELAIVGAALAEYPYYQVEASLRNVGRQIAMIALAPGTFRSVQMTSAGELLPASSVAMLDWHRMVQIGAIAMSLLLLVLLFWRVDSGGRLMIGLLLLAILANDAICAIISAPDMRYQSRALWLLPLLASALIMRGRR